MTFEGHFSWHIYGYSIANTSCSNFLLVCALMWDLHVDYTISAMEIHLRGTFVSGTYLTIMYGVSVADFFGDLNVQ